MKPGYQTTEFYLTVVTAVLSWLDKSGIAPGLPTEAIYAVIAYVLGRVVVKAASQIASKGAKIS